MAITLLAKISNLVGVGKKLLFTNQSKIGELFIDGTHLETIDYSSEITNHPIETGSSISDHIYINPLKVKMEGSITEASVDIIGTVKDIAGLFDGNLLNNAVNKFKGNSTKLTAAYELLKDLHASKSLVTVINYLDTFDNMVIETLTFPRDNKVGNRLFFEITLKQITLASVKTVSISRNPRSVQDMINNKLETGRQQTNAPTPLESVKTSSALFNMFRS
jgi:hypothetical protein